MPLDDNDDAVLHHSSSNNKSNKSKSRSPKKHSVSSKVKKSTVHSNRLSLSGSGGGVVRASRSNNNNDKLSMDDHQANTPPRILSPSKQKKVNDTVLIQYTRIFSSICNAMQQLDIGGVHMHSPSTHTALHIAHVSNHTSFICDVTDMNTMLPYVSLVLLAYHESRLEAILQHSDKSNDVSTIMVVITIMMLLQVQKYHQ